MYLASYYFLLPFLAAPTLDYCISHYIVNTVFTLAFLPPHLFLINLFLPSRVIFFKIKVESSHSTIQYLPYLVSLRAKTQIITMTYKVSNDAISSIWPNLFLISLLFTLLQIPWLLIQDVRYVSPRRAFVLAVLYPWDAFSSNDNI